MITQQKDSVMTPLSAEKTLDFSLLNVHALSWHALHTLLSLFERLYQCARLNYRYGRILGPNRRSRSS